MAMFICERHGDRPVDGGKPDTEYTRSYLVMPAGFARVVDEDVGSWDHSDPRVENREEAEERMEGFIKANGRAAPVIHLSGCPGPVLPSLIEGEEIVGGGSASTREVRRVLHSIVDMFCDTYDEEGEIHIISHVRRMGEHPVTELTENTRKVYNDASLKACMRLKQPEATA